MIHTVNCNCFHNARKTSFRWGKDHFRKSQPFDHIKYIWRGLMMKWQIKQSWVKSLENDSSYKSYEVYAHYYITFGRFFPWTSSVRLGLAMSVHDRGTKTLFIPFLVRHNDWQIQLFKGTLPRQCELDILASKNSSAVQ